MRRGARWVHAALAIIVVVAVFLQVYLIGAYLFGAGQGALDAHKSIGYPAHSVEVAVLVAALVAWLPRTDVLLSLLLAVIGTAQVMLAEGDRWVGGLHPLGALVVVALAALLIHRAAGHRARRREPCHPAV